MIATRDDPTAATVEAYVDAAARFQGLTIDPAWRAGVVTHLTAIRAAADLMSSVPLDDEIEAAPIFTP